MDKLEMAFTHSRVWAERCQNSPWGSWWTVVGVYPDDGEDEVFTRSWVEIVRACDAKGAAVQARNERAWACEGGDSVSHLYQWFDMDSEDRERVFSDVIELADGCEVISVFEGKRRDEFCGPSVSPWEPLANFLASLPQKETSDAGR